LPATASLLRVEFVGMTANEYRAWSSTRYSNQVVQKATAATFSIFAVVHLAAPLSALLPSKPAYTASLLRVEFVGMTANEYRAWSSTRYSKERD
jgi:hypothetical protein